MELPFENKLSVMLAIEHWQKVTDIQFIERNEKNKSAFDDYIVFVKASGTTCASYVGRQGGKQEVKLAPRCHTMNTVHEIGHALGLWHEQSRIDRDRYIQVVWENIHPDHAYNFNQHISDGQDHGPYNYDSIMHYSSKAFSINGKPTIIPLQQGVTIGQREHLSQGDINAIRDLYAYPTERLLTGSSASEEVSVEETPPSFAEL